MKKTVAMIGMALSLTMMGTMSSVDVLAWKDRVAVKSEAQMVQERLESLKEKAVSGMFPNCDVSLGMSKKQVKKRMTGSPEINKFDDGYEMVYAGGFSFIMSSENKAEALIMELDARGLEIMRDDVEKVFGKPASIQIENGEKMLYYNIGDYTVSFAFPVKHISFATGPLRVVAMEKVNG